jgi:hypothetical protein
MIKKPNTGFQVLGSDLSYMGVQVIFKPLDFCFQVDMGLSRIKMRGDHEIEMDWKRFLKSPDIRKPQHGIAAMGKDDSFQKMELLLEEAFEGGFDQVAAIRRKMGLDMRNFDWSPHEAKRVAACSVDEFLRYIGTEKADGGSVFWKMGSDLWVT